MYCVIDFLSKEIVYTGTEQECINYLLMYYPTSLNFKIEPCGKKQNRTKYQ